MSIVLLLKDIVNSLDFIESLVIYFVNFHRFYNGLWFIRHLFWLIGISVAFLFRLNSHCLIQSHFHCVLIYSKGDFIGRHSFKILLGRANVCNLLVKIILLNFKDFLHNLILLKFLHSFIAFCKDYGSAQLRDEVSSKR